MRLFLIRHGETVDNVANVYAGSRDSTLSAHGALQTRLLAQHLTHHGPPRAHIFSSDLQRAAKTAEAIRDAGGHEGKVHKLVQLREKDFGAAEGAKFGSPVDETGGESTESMRRRIDQFLDDHLLPLCGLSDGIIIVAHGIILGVLYGRLCDRLPRTAVTVADGAQPRAGSSRDPLPVSWRNTGYLETILSVGDPVSWSTMKLRLLRVNCVQHLEGLRRTRGGIGSARFDEKQRTMDSFVISKKQKLADNA